MVEVLNYSARGCGFESPKCFYDILQLPLATGVLLLQIHREVPACGSITDIVPHNEGGGGAPVLKHTYYTRRSVNKKTDRQERPTMMAHGSLNGDDLPPQELIPSHMAAASNNIQELARLVREGASLIDPSTKETALHAAAQHGANETLTWLLINKKGSPLDKALSGSTAAHLAVVYGHLEALKVLRF